MATNTIIFIVGSVLAFPPFLLAILHLKDRYSRKAKQQRQQDQPSESGQSANTFAFKLRALQRPDPNERLLSKLNVILVVTSLPLLFFDGFVIYYAATQGFESELDVGSLFFLALLFGLPIFVILDVFFLQPQKRRRGTSSVAESATLELDGNTDELFNTCHQALTDMGGRIIQLNRRTRLIRADFSKDVMTVRIQRTPSRKNRVSVLSDSKWISVVIDGGRNRSNVDAFIRKICG